MGTVILFILVLGLLVLVHEFGHFFVARRSGMKVYEFGFGFPPRAFGFYRDPKTKKMVFVKGRGKNSLKETVGGEDRATPDEFPATVYSFNWLPLGGFVKIKGENGDSAGDVDSFGAKPFWKKALTIVSGVAMNWVLAAVLLAIGFMIGLPAEKEVLQDPRAIVVQEPMVTAQEIAHDSPAEAAGVHFGDQLVSISGVPLITSSDLVAYISAHPSEESLLEIKRGEEELTLPITPAALSADDQTPRLGIVLADAGIVRYPWHIALWRGVQAAYVMFLSIFIAFYYLIKGLILGQGMGLGVAGPVGIAVVVGESARLGLSHLISIVATLSLSLAAINILPIPALDGGRLFFIVYERIFRKPVPMRYEQLAHTIGFILLMILIIVVTFRDITRLF